MGQSQERWVISLQTKSCERQRALRSEHEAFPGKHRKRQKSAKIRYQPKRQNRTWYQKWKLWLDQSWIWVRFKQSKDLKYYETQTQEGLSKTKRKSRDQVDELLNATIVPSRKPEYQWDYQKKRFCARTSELNAWKSGTRDSDSWFKLLTSQIVFRRLLEPEAHWAAPRHRPQSKQLSDTWVAADAEKHECGRVRAGEKFE